MILKRLKTAGLILSGILAACGTDPSGEQGSDTTDGDTDDTDDTDSVDSETEGPIPDNYYSVIVNGKALPVERVSKFEVPINYVRLDYAGESLEIEVTPKDAFDAYSLSPKSRNFGAESDGDTLSFRVEEPVYAILQIPGKERLFILIDPPEDNPPRPGDENVKNIMDYEGVDNTGETDITEVVQAAIDEVSGSSTNILYFPKGTYAVQTLFMKSEMTVYLAKGAVLLNVTPQNKLMSHPEGLSVIELSSRALIIMNGVTNAKLTGRGMLDGNGVELQSYNRKMFLLKIENSSDCEVEGILSLDSCFWNTLIYRSDNINIHNYKVINNRLDDEWNETDGVDFDNCTNSKLFNAFLYTGDDCMAVKADDIQDGSGITGVADPTTDENYINVNKISHEKIVCFSGSSACKVGTKTFGESMKNISFKDVDVVTSNRAMVIDAVDTAHIDGTVFEDIRIEDATGRLVDFNMDPQSITWRKVVGTCTVTNTTVKNVSADVSQECQIKGNIHDWKESDPYYGNEYFIDGVTFENFEVGGEAVTSVDDPDVSFNLNEYATNITFAP